MNKLVLFLCGLLCWAFLGCANTVAIKEDTKQYIKNVDSVEIFETEKMECVRSQSKLIKTSWKDLIKSANFCIKIKKWSSVKVIGLYLAKSEPNSPWGAYYLSLEAEHQKQLPRALWMVEASLKKVPNQPILLYQKGRLLWKMGNLEAGVEAMEASIKTNAKMSAAKLFLAKIELRDQQYSRAYDLFNQVAKLFPKSVDAHVGIAECLFQKQSWEEAISSWNHAIHLKPKNLKYRLRRIQIMDEKLGQVSESLAEYRKVKYLKSKGRLVGKLPPYVQVRIDQLEVAAAALEVKKLSQREPAQKKKVSK